MQKTKFLSIIIPALNEENLIKATYLEVKKSLTDKYRHEIIFIDDGSTDKTLQIMEGIKSTDQSIKIIKNIVNQGLGNSYFSGVRNAIADYVVMVPADNSFKASSLQKLFDNIGSADLLIPYHTNAAAARHIVRNIISKFFTGLINFSTSRSIPYYNGTVVHRSSLIKKVKTQPHGFSYQAEIIIELLNKGHSFQTVGIEITERKDGSSRAFSKKNILETSFFILKLLSHKIIKRTRKHG